MILKKIFRISFIVTGTLLVLLIGADIYLHHWLNKQLPAILNQSPNRSYDIRYQNFSINLVSRNLVINHITIAPVQHLDTANTDDSTEIEAAVDHFVIQDVHLAKLFFHKEIYTSHLFISHPSVKLDIVPGKRTPQDSQQVKMFLRDFFDRIRVNNIDLEQATFAIDNRRTTSEIVTMGPFDLRLQKVIADSSTITSPFPFRYHEVLLNGQSLTYHLNQFYTIHIPHYRLRGGDLLLDSLSLDPVYSKTAFQHHIQYQHDWYHLVTGKITLKRVIWGFLSDEPFADILLFSTRGADFHVYRDKRLPYPPFKKKTLLESFLQRLPFQLTIDSVRVKDSKITYEEHPNAARQSGEITFDHIFCNGINLTNDPARLKKNADLIVKAQSDFMNVTKLKADFNFQLATPGDDFSVTGSLGALQANDLNRALKPLAAVSATGQIQGLDFTIRGNDIKAHSVMRFLYDSLSLNIFKKEGGAENWIMTAIANIFVRNHNMPGDNKFNEATFDFTRYQNRSYFNYLWQCIKRGALYTMMDARHSTFKKREVQKLLQKTAPEDVRAKK